MIVGYRVCPVCRVCMPSGGLLCSFHGVTAVGHDLQPW